MIRFLILLSALLIRFQIHAHSVTKVLYDFKQNDKSITVEVDLPWTLKYELETFDTSLKTEKTRENFNRILKNYIAEHLELTDVFGNPIVLVSVEKDHTPKEHLHGEAYVFGFENKKIQKIKNNMFCLTVPKQKNVNKLFIKVKPSCLFTTCNAPVAELLNSKDYSVRIVIILITIVVTGLILNKKISS